jgi:hypothetical protein
MREVRSPKSNVLSQKAEGGKRKTDVHAATRRQQKDENVLSRFPGLGTHDSRLGTYFQDRVV